jgi:hypothetical protein
MEKDDASKYDSNTPQPRFDDTGLKIDLSAVAAMDSVDGSPRTQQGTGVQRHAKAAVSDPKAAT